MGLKPLTKDIKQPQPSSTAPVNNTPNPSNDTPGAHDSSFQSGKALYIDARGYLVFRVPTAPSQLVIYIYNEDDSIAYISTREKKSSGNAILSTPASGPLASTTYFLGPNRDPIVRLLKSNGPDIKVTGRWTSRQQTFTAPNRSTYVWRHIRSQDDKMIVLEKAGGRLHGTGRRIAQLVREKPGIGEGTFDRTVGKGGWLYLARDAGAEMDEALIVATCIVVLKKEIDRVRASGMAVFGSFLG